MSAYNATKAALYTPAEDVTFFANGRPESHAELCAEMSRLAYLKFEDGDENRSSLEAILQAVGFNSWKFFNRNGTQCFYCRDSEASILSFRGTESDDPTDVFTDAYALPLRWSGAGRVHAGFAAALRLVQDDISALLSQHDLPLIITGHSLGAALATLAASIWTPHALYTFGSPRVGDDEFGASLASIDTHERFVDCCDIVTRVPPELGIYKHVGELNYIDQNGSIVRQADDDVIDADRSSARAAYLLKYTFVKGNVSTRDLADHAPVNYLSAFAGRT
jgi:hypothetical protein